MDNESLESEINELLSNQTEGEYWDFKLKWQENNADLLHDIICMANNQTDHDGYIIFGIEDQTYDVKGVPDTDRKTQQMVIDVLKSIKFAGGIRPTVYVKKIKIDDKPIDVLIIKNTRDVPYYLTENYQKVSLGNTYVRVGDTNTPKDKTADIDKVEYLWKKRFGLNLLPKERAKQLLSNLEDWEESSAIPGFPKKYFNKFASEYTVTINDTENDKKLKKPS
ncbi:MAG: ATP-binding protein, partial [Deltaproteobacteria bacterium]|nr:ATP-binding protein [Deltaproteobacteria bacterium]